MKVFTCIKIGMYLELMVKTLDFSRIGFSGRLYGALVPLPNVHM